MADQPRRPVGRPARPEVPRGGLISEADKRMLAAAARAAQSGDRSRMSTPATKAVPGTKSREQELAEENVALKAQLSAIKGIAVSMGARSARISQVPGHVLADFSNQILKEINRAKTRTRS